MYESADQLLHDLHTKDGQFWIKQGEDRALYLFHGTAQGVPAYKDFLSKNEIIDHEKIKTFEDFKKFVPVMDKENYIRQYSVPELCWKGRIGEGATIATSSGTTGSSLLWPRQDYHEERVSFIHEAFLQEFFCTEDTPTLFLVCFHLGSHIAGLITANVIKKILVRGKVKGAIITPGLSREDISKCLHEASPYFGRIVLVGYPPFIKEIVEQTFQQGVDMSGKKIGFLFAAESFPEEWRDYIHRFVEVNLKAEAFSLNIYGSADLGFMGHETPFTINLRKEYEKGNRAVLGEFQIDFTPALFQYHPWQQHFESINGELVCTGDGGLPLVRYNIHDLGHIINFASIIKDDKQALSFWNLPTVVVAGRSNHSATIYGLNIYPEQIREVLLNKKFLPLLSGRFFLRTIFDNAYDQKLEIHIELAEGISVVSDVQDKIFNDLVAYLKDKNLEYNKLSQSIGNKALPFLYLYPSNSSTFFNNKKKQNYVIRNNS